MNEIVSEEEQIDSSPIAFPLQITGIIADLLSLIGQINANLKNAKELILELARRMDEVKLCEKNQICRKIKGILKDKIKQGQVSDKWIEECLSEEYKRKYTKSEQTSVSTKVKKSQEMVIDNKGNICAESLSPKRSDIENTSYRKPVGRGSLPELQEKHLENSEMRNDNEGGCPRCIQLEEALIKASPISTAEYLSENTIKFIIPRHRYKEIKSAMRRSTDSLLLIVDGTSRSLLSVDPDSFR